MSSFIFWFSPEKFPWHNPKKNKNLEKKNITVPHFARKKFSRDLSQNPGFNPDGSNKNATQRKTSNRITRPRPGSGPVKKQVVTPLAHANWLIAPEQLVIVPGFYFLSFMCSTMVIVSDQPDRKHSKTPLMSSAGAKIFAETLHVPLGVSIASFVPMSHQVFPKLV